FGLRRSLSLAAAVGLLSAILLLGVAPFRKPAARTTIVFLLLGLMIVVGSHAASWDPRLVASGLYRYGARGLERFGSPAQFLASRQGIEVPFFHEGTDSCVTVERTVLNAPGVGATENLALTVDGKIEATNDEDVRTQILQGQIPLLVHGPADSILLIDFLNGVTAGSILRHPVKSLTVIEKEPALFEASAQFSDYNHEPLGDERLVRIADTARARLLADENRYDVIILAAMEPWLPHDAALLTSEGYALVKSRLRPSGVVAQRVPTRATSEPALKAVLRTFARSFDSVLVFQISREDLLLVGAGEPLAFDVGWARNIIGSNAGVSSDLRRIAVFGPSEILLTYRLDGAGLRSLLGEGPGNDDDRNLVEFVSAAQMTVHVNQALLEAVDRAWAGLLPVLKNYGALPQERAEFLYNLAKSYLGIAGDPRRARDLALELSGLGHPAMARWVTGECLMQERDIDGSLEEWRAVLDLEPNNLDALFSLGTYYLDGKDFWKAEDYLARAARVDPDTPVVRYHYGRVLYSLGRYAPAIDELRAARTLGKDKNDYPLVDYLVGVSLHKLGKEKEAAESLKTYLKWAYSQTTLTRLEVDAHLNLAEVYDKQGRRFDAHKERQKAEELQRRIVAYARQQEAASGAGAIGSAPDAVTAPGSTGILPGAAASPEPTAPMPGAAASPGPTPGAPGRP
ncbi:MAG TPA: tetratricopeptide repeat protein, partial [Candidatus Polarisedimenticolia bacterium]|nr:tetratricopeptide repeat protein [Candidatus Polarisedimenticolia bacterium]